MDYVFTKTGYLAGERLTVYLGDGKGSFNLSFQLFESPDFRFPRNLIIGDFNGDGNQDIVTANYSSNNVTLLPGNGLGGFGTAITIAGSGQNAIGTSPIQVVAGDFNNDGKMDFATANYTSGNITVCIGNGNLCVSNAHHQANKNT